MNVKWESSFEWKCSNANGVFGSMRRIIGWRLMIYLLWCVLNTKELSRHSDRVYGKINRLAIIYSYDINYLDSIRCVFIFLQSLNWFFTIPGHLVRRSMKNSHRHGGFFRLCCFVGEWYEEYGWAKWSIIMKLWTLAAVGLIYSNWFQ